MKKIKYFLSAFTIFLLVNVVRVSADEVFSDGYKLLTSSNSLAIQYKYSENDEIGDIYSVLYNYIANIQRDNENYYFNIATCNDDFSVCTVTLIDISGNLEPETHELNITYTEVFSDEFKNLTSNNNFLVKTKIHNNQEADLVPYVETFNTNSYNFKVINCNSNSTQCEIVLTDISNGGATEKHLVNITYEEVYSDLFKAFAPNNELIVPCYNINNDMSAASLNSYLGEKSTEINSYTSNYCNDTFTECLISVFDSNYQLMEEHLVNISYEEKVSDEFSKILTNGKLVVKESTLSTNKTSIINNTLNKYSLNGNNFSFDSSTCNNDFTKCKVYMSSNNEVHYVDIVYNEEYSDNFKKLSSDGKIVITSSTIGDKTSLVNSYVGNLQLDNMSFYVSECNEDASKCVIQLNQYSPYIAESHVINIVYNEVIGDLFKDLIVDGNIVVWSIKPKDEIQQDFFMQSYLNNYNTSDAEYSVGMCNNDYSICDINVYVHGEDSSYSESHKANITYAKIDTNKQTQVNKVLENVSEDKKFVVEDLENINFIVNSGFLDYRNRYNVQFNYINYSSELKKLLGNKNITATLDVRAGIDPIFVQENLGGYILSYDGVSYGLFQGGAVRKNVIYIPDDTEETKEAYIKAAQDRINEYLGNNKVKLEYAGKLSEFEDLEYMVSNHELLELNNLKDEYYYLTHEDYEDVIEYFVIYKDSSKMQSVESQTTSDVLTNISISMNNSSIPLDTSIKVNELNKGSEEYNEITSKLSDYNTENALVYDLKLYSSSIRDYITKLEDGTFKVSIPISEELNNKDLIVYYVNEDGKVSKYDVESENGYATFVTDHFSIYTLAAKQSADVSCETPSENNPNTYDGIVIYLVLGIVSIVGIIGLFAYKKKMQ